MSRHDALPVADHTLLLYLAQLVMTGLVNPPAYRSGTAFDGPVRKIQMDVPTRVFDEWVQAKNAPYEPGESKLFAAYEFADAAMCYWAEYCAMLKGEIQARTGRDPGEIKTRQEKLQDHIKLFPLLNVESTAKAIMFQRTETIVGQLEQWFKKLQELMR